MARDVYNESDTGPQALPLGTLYLGANPATNYVYPAYSSRPREINRVWGQTHPGPPYHEGGPVNIWHFADRGMVSANAGNYTAANWTYCRYEGAFCCSYALQSFDPILGLNINQLGSGSTWEDWGDPSSYGPTGWNRFAPGQAISDLGQFIGEFRDVPRMLMTTAKGFRDLWLRMGGSRTGFGPKSVANHWLNTQFGWLPFVNDLRKFERAWRTCDEQIARIRKYNGKWQRRGGTVTHSENESVVSESSTQTAHWPVLNSYFYQNASQTGSRKVTLREYNRVWFRGAFRYWIPDINSVNWERRARRYLWGAYVSPALVWELTPWSWLIDWFTTVGDSIANTDTGWAENLAAKYAYVMGTKEMEFKVDSVHNLKGYAPLEAQWTYPIVRKARVPASPFGFGLTSDMFSPRQWSILAALGLSRWG